MSLGIVRKLRDLPNVMVQRLFSKTVDIALAGAYVDFTIRNSRRRSYLAVSLVFKRALITSCRAAEKDDFNYSVD